jgi:hypothetical protein
MIIRMSEQVRRRRVGRPATLSYTPVQMNLKVHPSVRRSLQAEAERRGLKLGALLTELVADAVGTTVDELTAETHEEDNLIRRSA